ncbi:BglG family transcription antiterminator [Brevibacillus fulvus]|uniref:Transcriptional antiterminator n=1 Tax=Brevibacillus fulvus TaxID=1125967 RepID=A0A939BR83_9BACL|nr:PRD domain-containing protein [Brevibacillus fulvus]MBM7589203.1 transcriptional antiterminator [Brevibacillus fulvus]
MRERYAKLLHILQNTPGFVTGKELSQQLNISSRTLRNDIKELNDHYLLGARIISNNRQGYQLSGQLTGFKQRQHHEFEGRAFYIVKALLDSSDWITYDQLSRLIYFSPQTIRADIQKIAQLITSQKRNLSIEALVFQGVRLVGDEFDKRLLLESLVEKNFMTIQELHQEFLVCFRDWIKEAELHPLTTVIIDQLTKYVSRLPTQKLSSLLAHLVITVYRLRQGETIAETKIKMSEQYEEFRLADAILDEVERICRISINQHERIHFGLHLISQRLVPHSDYDTSQVSERLKTEIEESLQMLGEQYGFRFTEDRQLVAGLLYHLAKVQYPLRFQLYVDNPFLSEIKMEYLLAYHIAALLAHRLEKSLNLDVPESEIGYIALHLAAHMEQTKKQKVKVAIVPGSGIGASLLFRQKIERTFLDIEIVGEYSMQTLERIEPDVSLIISAMELEQRGTPIVRVQEFLDDGDMEKIACAINHDFLERTLSPDRFLLMQEETKIDFLQRFVTEMKIEHLLDSLLAREEMSSTEVGNGVAMPHPIEREDLGETKIFIGINQKGILWGSSHVQLVFLLLPSEVDREHHYKIFKRLHQLVKNKETVKELIQAEDFASFTDILRAY